MIDNRWKSIFALLSDPNVSEVQANGPNEFFIKKSGERLPINVKFNTLEEYYTGIETSLVPNMKGVKEWERDSFLFEGPLIFNINGKKIQSRCHIALPPATLSPQITIAKKSTSLVSLDDISDKGSMAKEMKDFLKLAVEKRLNIVISGSTGAGKALSLDTKIPTPTGFTTMRDIKVGDEIFDRFGNIGKVLNKFPQPLRKVYKVELETGEEFECDAEHNWIFSSDKKTYHVKTTEELYNLNERVMIPTLKGATAGNIALNEPYKLGVSIAEDDAEFPKINNVAELDRIELLKGILDTNGRFFEGDFRINYREGDDDFNNNIINLASSLGFKVYKDTHIRIISPVPLSNNVVIIEGFKKYWEEYEWPSDFYENILVNRILKTDEVKDMACISVDTMDETYLIGDGFVPTHNTTMLEAFTRYMDKDARVGIAEDTPELNLPDQPNKTFLHSVPHQPGLDPNKVASLDWVVQQFQRMRTDILLVGEIRGKEFASFLIAANSGMDGSMTTIHANNSKQALNKMSNFALLGAEKQPLRAVNTDIANSIDLIVQLGILYDGRYKVLEITEVTNTLSNDEQSTISTECLYRYNQVDDTFIKEGTMTDSLRKKLENRGANISQFLSQPIGTVFRTHSSAPIPTVNRSNSFTSNVPRRMGLPT